MITESLIQAIDRGREGREQGYSIGLSKLEQIIDGVCKGTYTLIGAESGVGCNFQNFYLLFLIRCKF